MPEFYTWAILLINQQDEIGEMQLSVFGSRCTYPFNSEFNFWNVHGITNTSVLLQSKREALRTDQNFN